MAESRQANVPAGTDPKTPGGSSPFEGKSSSSAAVGGMRKTLNSIVPPRYQPLTISALVVAAAGYYLYYGPKRAYHSQNQQQQNSIGTPSPAPVSAPAGSGQMAGGQQSVQPGKEVKRGVTEKRA